MTLYFLWGTSIIGLDFDIGSNSSIVFVNVDIVKKNNSNPGEKNTKCVANYKLIFFQS